MCRKLIYLISFALALGITVSIADADITTGFVSHWKLDEMSGTIAKDSVGDNDGTLIGDTTWTEGWFSGAVEFDGDGDYIDCGNSKTFDIRDAVTLLAWVKPDPDFAYPDWSGIIIKGSAVDYDTFAFYYKGPTKEIGFKTGDTLPNARAWYPIPAEDLFDGDWHHVAAVYDGTTKSIYLDSEVIGATGSTGRIRISNGRCLLGAGRDYDPPIHYFVGKLDDARIYSRALTKDEIRLVMISDENLNLDMALLPEPVDQATEVRQDAVLSWMPGEHSDTHDVYLGTVFDDVNDASRDSDPNGVLVSQNQDGAAYDPPGFLEFAQSYYWRVDEFNDLNPNSPWKSDVWSFQVVDYFTVDDFESYNDLDTSDPESNRIFNTWIDGYEQPTNGAIVGYADPPFAEQTTIHGGMQAMPYFYNNTAAATYSEAQRTFSPAQDWTREGVGVLSLWFSRRVSLCLQGALRRRGDYSEG
jgi:hypothetical protein